MGDTPRYYADCSMPAVLDHSFVVWTNLDGLRRVLTCYPSRFWWDDRGERNGEHFCMVIYPEAAGYYKWIVRLIRDCATVENMLADVEVMT